MAVGLILGMTIMLSLVMMLAWLIQRQTLNAGWVDVVWTFGLGLAGIVCSLVPVRGIASLEPRQIVVAALVMAWSVRLGWHLWDRTRHGSEDVRYAQFRRDWGPAFGRRMFGFLQLQAVVGAFLAVSIALAAHNPSPLGIQDGVALCILVIAIVGEAIADAQLRRFRTDAGNHGKVCDIGLWHLSRHPNYFFEWLGWLAYPLFAIDPAGAYSVAWLALSGPAMMYWLLVHVSGIPPLEQQMVRTRGAAYSAYQARTRAFVPLPLLRTQ